MKQSKDKQTKLKKKKTLLYSDIDTDMDFRMYYNKRLHFFTLAK